MDFNGDRNNDFLYHYQDNIFGQDSSKPFAVRDSKMECTIMSYVQSCLNDSNEMTCIILDEMLRDYGKLVDDRNGINNFAEATLSLLADVRIDNKLFESGLPEEIPNVEDLLHPLPADCRDGSRENCPNEVPTSDDIANFFRPVSKLSSPDVPENKVPLPKHGLCLDDVPTGVAPSTSLYGSYKGQSTKDSRIKPPTMKKDTHSDPSGSSYQSQTKVQHRFLDQKAYRKNNKRGVAHVGQDESDSLTDSNLNEKAETGVAFRTAGEQLRVQMKNKFGCSRQESGQTHAPVKKSLGGKSRYVSNKFIPPVKSNSQEEGFQRRGNNSQEFEDGEVDERLKMIDPKMVELIKSEIMDCGAKIDWEDIAGLHVAKTTIQEIVVWPMLRPDIFTGLRRPPKGILLFGPPGTGKTLIGKCIASQSSSTFFSISASSLTSKWIGDGEKMVRALFAVARCHQPAVVFIDEIDSLLSQRSESEHESSRRIKTEFLVQLDGASTGEEDRILIIGATNRPQELDEAARRRLVKRLYIPLPDNEARKQLVTNLMRSERNDLIESQIEEIAELTDGYSGADMKNLCQEACLGPIRSIAASQMFQISADSVRPVNIEDFKSALRRVRSSVSTKDLEIYKMWDQQYGSGGAPL